MYLEVQIQTASGRRRDFQLEVRSRAVVGRRNAHIQLEDKACSRTHCVIYSTKRGEIFIQDLQSRNGTYLNGKRITSASLRGGELIQVGETILRLRRAKSQTVSAKRSEAAIPVYGETNTRPLESNDVVHGSRALFACLPGVLPAKFSENGYLD